MLVPKNVFCPRKPYNLATGLVATGPGPSPGFRNIGGQKPQVGGHF